MLYVRFGSKGDITARLNYVRFAPESGHSLRRSRCPLWAKSGRNRVLALLLKRPPDEAERALHGLI
jgi:hypothetical protein